MLGINSSFIAVVLEAYFLLFGKIVKCIENPPHLY